MGASVLADGGELGGEPGAVACAVDAAAVPVGGAVAGQTYQIRVAAGFPSQFKLHASDGACLGDKGGGEALTREHIFSWTAAATGPSTFYALCSSGYMALHAARATAGGSSGAGGAGAGDQGGDHDHDHDPTEAPGSTNVPAKSGDVKLGETGLTLVYQISAESGDAEFTVRSQVDTWVGFGFSGGKSVSMSASGEGADLVVCSDGEVRRYLVTGHDLPSDYVSVAGSSCEHSSEGTALKFKRPGPAIGAWRHEVTPGKQQQVIFARGSAGDRTVGMHKHQNRGGILLDFVGGRSAELGKGGAALIMVHAVSMAVAWCLLLPLGAMASRLFRHVPEWLTAHKRLQVGGWLMMIVGFACATAYVTNHSEHYSSPHARIGAPVVLFGALAPVLGVLRPAKPAAGQPRSWARVLFEAVHKYGGWVAIAAGVGNACAGVALLSALGFASQLTVAASAVVGACVAAVATVAGLGLARQFSYSTMQVRPKPQD